MENWEDILKKEQARQQAYPAEEKQRQYQAARTEADKNIRLHYQPIEKLLGLEEHLKSIRDRVWKKGTLSLRDELQYYDYLTSGFQGQGARRNTGFSHTYEHVLTSGLYRLGISFRGDSSMSIGINASPSVNANIHGTIREFTVYTWQTENVAKLPNQFEVGLAEYCKLMTERGHLTLSGLVS